MLTSSVAHFRCPREKKKVRCHGALQVQASRTLQLKHLNNVSEVQSGHLLCTKCKAQYPILGGVAIIVPHVRDYLLTHVKGIAQTVSDAEIPREFLHEYREAKSEIQSEHIEEDLEAERVTALYVMNHYLRSTTPASHSEGQWWKPQSDTGSPLVDSLIRQYWDHGPFAQIRTWVQDESTRFKKTLELGCGVGGLYSVLKSQTETYLGVDSSFGSIALARHLALGLPYSGSLKIPEDLLHGPVSRSLKLPPPPACHGQADFIVGDLDYLPIQEGIWDLSLSLNTIDMLENPSSLPQLQFDLLRPEGLAIQSCPYIWHPKIAHSLRKQLPPAARLSSSRAVEWLYERKGFQIQKSAHDIPWLFFKHVRQLEIYSVHAFVARKPKH